MLYVNFAAKLVYNTIMIQVLAYILSLLALFAIAITLCAYLVTAVYSTLKGSPFVPTSSQKLQMIFDVIHPKINQQFIELGSGDGRVVRYVAKTYGVSAIGIEINPLLYFYSILITKLQHISSVTFLKKNFYDIDMSKADFIYIFLLPATIKKLSHIFSNECKKGCVLISHGFAIHELQDKQFHLIESKPFKTFFYRI